jgi:cytochrome P450
MATVLAPYLTQGYADLVELGYRVVMNLTADFAGVDRPDNDIAETELLLALVKTFSTGATLVHSTREPEEINREVAQAMHTFSVRFLQPSIARRQTLMDVDAALPNDVLSILLSNGRALQLTPEVIRREIAFFLQAGAHSTANSLVHAIDEIFAWFQADPARRDDLTDPIKIQRAVHESLRLHPASPVALRRAICDCELLGHHLRAGDLVSVDLLAANRDRDVFGIDAHTFNPLRQLERNVWPFGLTFGYGTHACLGRDLDGGVRPRTNDTDGTLQMGIVPLLVRTLLDHGVAPSARALPQRDSHTHRDNFAVYPIEFFEASAA